MLTALERRTTLTDPLYGGLSLQDPASHAEAEIRALITAPYVQDAAIYDLSPPLSQRGMDLRREQAWLDTWDGPIDLESRDGRLGPAFDLEP